VNTWIKFRLSVSQIDVAYSHALRKIFILELENPIYQRLEYFSSNKLCKWVFKLIWEEVNSWLHLSSNTIILFPFLVHFGYSEKLILVGHNKINL
jgi:hypothetical protein